MINIVEMILMGVFATLVMDIMAITFAKLKITHPKIGPEAVGRWTLYMFRGKFFHKDINKTPALPNEILTSWIAHYLIGIALAGVYLFMELKLPEIDDQPLMALIFGILTVLLPWIWLFPSMGIGFLASKMPEKSPYIFTSLVNHTDFGIGMALWIVVFRNFLV